MQWLWWTRSGDDDAFEYVISFRKQTEYYFYVHFSWNHAFKNQISTLQNQAKDKQVFSNFSNILKLSLQN